MPVGPAVDDDRARSHSETAQRLLKSESTEADHAIAGFPNSGFRKFLLRRLQLLKTTTSGLDSASQRRTADRRAPEARMWASLAARRRRGKWACF
jgi:hypothetical protein